MTLGQLCTNLELSKELKELGVKQESQFYWCYDYKNGEKSVEINQWIKYTENRYKIICSAFLASELGEILPEKFYFQDRWYFFLTTWKRATGEYGARYKPNTERNYLPAQIGKTEADARAKVVIYLIKNSLITL